MQVSHTGSDICDHNDQSEHILALFPLVYNFRMPKATATSVTASAETVAAVSRGTRSVRQRRSTMLGPQPSTVVIDEDQLVVMAGINTLLADKSDWTTGAANKHMHEGVSRGKPVVGQGSSKRHKAIPSTPESSDVESVVDANDICVESTSSVQKMHRSFRSK